MLFYVPNLLTALISHECYYQHINKDGRVGTALLYSSCRVYVIITDVSYLFEFNDKSLHYMKNDSERKLCHPTILAYS